MANPNHLNAQKGRMFQLLAFQALTNLHGLQFESDKPISIGNPVKAHKFDLVSQDGSMVAEAKSYTWTDGGNVPSAKMMGINEAVFYLHFLKNKVSRRMVVLEAEKNKRTGETIAEYYHRMNRHLLDGVEIWELDAATLAFRKI